MRHEFARAGTLAAARQWLDGGCQQTPEEVAEIIRSFLHGDVVR